MPHSEVIKGVIWTKLQTSLFDYICNYNVLTEQL